jgi:hypothetical protein
MLVMGRVRDAAIFPSRDDRSERAKTIKPSQVIETARISVTSAGTVSP